jgi:predicted kinase
METMIEVLCGFISSGKSTWAKQRAREGWVILNDDAIVNAVHGGDYTLYNESWKPLYKGVEDQILHLAVAMGKNVLVDRGVDVRRASRARWIALGRSLDVEVIAVVFQVFRPEVHAQRRFESDPRGLSQEYWLKVARNHAGQYERATLDEGFASITERHWE